MESKVPKTILSVKQLSAGYGVIVVLRGVTVTLRQGELVSVIGANGAGKSTLLKSICGLNTLHGGEILLDDRDITHLPTHQRVSLGIAMVPEGRQLFSSLTVLQNLKLGAYTRWMSKGYSKRDMERQLDYVFSLFPVLYEKRFQEAQNLSGGQQQMLAIGRALMSEPRLLILDEPSLGLAPQMVELIFGVLNKLRSQGLSILLVEQDIWGALELSSRCYVMQVGRIALEAHSHALKEKEKIHEFYLGMTRANTEKL